MKAYIKAISYYLPEKVLTNEELVEIFPEWNVEKIALKVGINKRYISDEKETAVDMAVKASKKLILEHNINKDEIDFILLCTQSPDYFLPTSACIVQDMLDMPTAIGALDFNLGCSGYIYGLSLAKGLIVSGTAKNVLLITSETYTKKIHPQDKGNRSIFSDAATASLISDHGFASIENFKLGTDGSGFDNLILKSGCFREPAKQNDTFFDSNGNPLSSDYIRMNGSEIFNFTIDVIPNLIKNTLKANSLEINDIGLFIFHQANKFMLDFLRKKIGISSDIFFTFLSEVGNTVSSTIPIAIYNAKKEGKLFEKKIFLS
jgi:3-oxoacyl-[acyl-carrier-protein] synthase-3